MGKDIYETIKPEKGTTKVKKPVNKDSLIIAIVIAVVILLTASKYSTLGTYELSMLEIYYENGEYVDILTEDKINQWDAAEANVQSDWDETDTTSSAFIKNKI